MILIICHSIKYYMNCNKVLTITIFLEFMRLNMETVYVNISSNLSAHQTRQWTIWVGTLPTLHTSSSSWLYKVSGTVPVVQWSEQLLFLADQRQWRSGRALETDSMRRHSPSATQHVTAEMGWKEVEHNNWGILPAWEQQVADFTTSATRWSRIPQRYCCSVVREQS